MRVGEYLLQQSATRRNDKDAHAAKKLVTLFTIHLRIKIQISSGFQLQVAEWLLHNRREDNSGF